MQSDASQSRLVHKSSLAKHKKRRIPSHLGHTILTIIFPPVGLYFAWKKGTLDHVLPKFVCTDSAIFFLLSLPMYGAPTTLKSFSDSYRHLSAPILVAVTTLLAVCVVGVIMGYLHMRAVSNNHLLSKSDKAFLLALIGGIILFNTVLSLFITTLTVNEIYARLHTVKL